MSAAPWLEPAIADRSLAPRELPRAPGAYQWFYADASNGDVTLVVLFMVGSPFSRRYAASPGDPSAHSAVNVAVYRAGHPMTWVLTEYPQASLESANGGATLRIGPSSLTWREDGRVTISIDEREPGRNGRRIRLDGDISPQSPRLGPIELAAGHHWEGLALRAHGSFSIPDLSIGMRARAYLDSNRGDEPLGQSLPRWRWTRALGRDDTRVLFLLPDGGGVLAFATDRRATYRALPRIVRLTPGDAWTGWGLRVPQQLELAPGAPVRRLESSPFYARLEASTDGAHVMSEVADFRRFRAPWIRWMADFRTRREVAR